MAMLQDKAAFRLEMKSRIQQKKPWLHAEVTNGLTQNILRLLETESGLWLGYKAKPYEANPEFAIRASSHIRWVWPKVEGQELRLFMSNNFEMGPFGIMEPKAQRSDEVQLHQISGVLVPGLAFDQSKARMGRGKGFYDRLLAGFKGEKIGVGFSCQIMEENIPHEKHDCRMDILVSEERIWK